MKQSPTAGRHHGTTAGQGLVAAPLTQVRIDGGFWGRLMAVNRRHTLPIQYKRCKETGRIDAFKLDWIEVDPILWTTKCRN